MVNAVGIGSYRIRVYINSCVHQIYTFRPFCWDVIKTWEDFLFHTNLNENKRERTWGTLFTACVSIQTSFRWCSSFSYVWTFIWPFNQIKLAFCFAFRTNINVICNQKHIKRSELCKILCIAVANKSWAFKALAVVGNRSGIVSWRK